jgi:hypothetical protein
VPLWDNVRLKSDFQECGSGSSKYITDLPPWSAVSLTPFTTGQRCH